MSAVRPENKDDENNDHEPEAGKKRLNEISPSTKRLKISGNTTGFIYDVSVNLLYDGVGCSKSIFELNRASMSTVVANIIHKYKKWSVAGEIIMVDLIKKAAATIPQIYNQRKSFKWEATINAQGCFYEEDVIEDLPAVYDCLSFVGFLKPQQCESIQDPKSYSMILNYNVTFFLSPALQVGMSYYQSKGFAIQDPPNYVHTLDFHKVCDTLDYDEPFNHRKVWEISLLETLGARK